MLKVLSVQELGFLVGGLGTLNFNFVLPVPVVIRLVSAHGLNSVSLQR
jgi:hypothetical protein